MVPLSAFIAARSAVATGSNEGTGTKWHCFGNERSTRLLCLMIYLRIFENIPAANKKVLGEFIGILTHE